MVAEPPRLSESDKVDSRYFTGKPCVYGHIAYRRIKDRKCTRCLALKARRHKKANPDRVRAQRRRQMAANPVTRNARSKRWRDAHPVQAKAGSRRRSNSRRARKLDAIGSYTAVDIRKIFVKQHGLCAAPNCRASLLNSCHEDHKIPLSRGGSNWPNNIQLMCVPCNLSKGARTMEEWLNWLHEVGRI